MPVSSTKGRPVKRDVTPTSVNRLAAGAMTVTEEAFPPKLTIGLGFPSVPMAICCGSILISTGFSFGPSFPTSKAYTCISLGSRR